MHSDGPAIDHCRISAYTIPTDAPEADGTYHWDATTLVLVEVNANGQTGLGYSYADVATAQLIQELLVPVVQGRNACDIRNVGRR